MPPMLLYYTQLKIKMALNSNNILEQLFGVKVKLLAFLQHLAAYSFNERYCEKNRHQKREAENLFCFY